MAKIIIHYLTVTKNLRKNVENLFIIINKLHHAVNSQFISTWIKDYLNQAGIDIHFTAHSTRHAATSAVNRKGVHINLIRKTASWSRQSEVFARFYNRLLLSDQSFFASTVLGDR